MGSVTGEKCVFVERFSYDHLWMFALETLFELVTIASQMIREQ